MVRKKSKPQRRAPVRPLLEVSEEADRKLCEVIAEYRGDATTLESAIGALVLGQHFGWRALRIIHSPSTFRKYEGILGFKFEDHVPERTHLSSKLLGISIADQTGRFWDVVMGRHKVKGKGVMSND